MPRRPLDPPVCPPIIIDDGSVDQKLIILENKLVPKNLGSIPEATELAEDSYLYVDNGGVPSKIKASEIGGEQVNADWAETDPESKAYILNKPTIPAGQVQADWAQTDATKLDYIKNKPALGALASKDKAAWEDLTDSLKQRIISDEAQIADNAEDINTLDSRVTQHDADIDEIQDDLLHIQDDIAHLEADKQNKLTAGANITITQDNVISAQLDPGSISYHDLSDKPTINGTVLEGQVELIVDGGLIKPSPTV